MSHILRVRPESGFYEEHKFGVTGSYLSGTLWILFTPKDIDDWVAIFGRSGVVEFDIVLEASDASFAYVTAGGDPYIIDHHSKQLLYKPTQYVTGAASIPNHPGIIAHNFTDLFVFGRHGLLWESGRVSRDGIVISSLSDQLITGWVETYSEGQEEFTLSVGDWQYKSSFKYGE
jgi:hypothetical protein